MCSVHIHDHHNLVRLRIWQRNLSHQLIKMLQHMMKSQVKIDASYYCGCTVSGWFEPLQSHISNVHLISFFLSGWLLHPVIVLPSFICVFVIYLSSSTKRPQKGKLPNWSQYMPSSKWPIKPFWFMISQNCKVAFTFLKWETEWMSCTVPPSQKSLEWCTYRRLPNPST